MDASGKEEINIEGIRRKNEILTIKCSKVRRILSTLTERPIWHTLERWDWDGGGTWKGRWGRRGDGKMGHGTMGRAETGKWGKWEERIMGKMGNRIYPRELSMRKILSNF